MNLIKQQVLLYLDQIHTQPIQTRNKTANRFVPFLKERDSLGRLLTKQLSSEPFYEMQYTDQSSPFKYGYNGLQTEKYIEQKVQNYFRNGTASNLGSPSRQKIHKKAILQIKTQRALSKTSQKAKPIVPKQLHLLRPLTHSAALIKTHSPFTPNSDKKDQNLIKRTISTMLPSKKPMDRSRSQISPLAVRKRQTYKQLKLKINQNVAQHPELIRVRRMKQLQVKLQNDFEQRHGQFLHKLIKSKQLAFEVKIGLEKIDDFF